MGAEEVLAEGEPYPLGLLLARGPSLPLWGGERERPREGRWQPRGHPGGASLAGLGQRAMADGEGMEDR